MLFIEKESHFFRIRPSQKLFTPMLFRSFLLSFFFHLLFFFLFQPQLSTHLENPSPAASVQVAVFLPQNITENIPHLKHEERPVVPSSSFFYIEEENISLPEDEDPHLEDWFHTTYRVFEDDPT